MKGKCIFIIFFLIALVLIGACSKNGNLYEFNKQEGKGIYPDFSDKERVVTMFKKYMENLETLPVTFTYGDNDYTGLGKGFKKLSHKTNREGNKLTHEIKLLFDKTITTTIVASVYPDYCAYEWTVYFENTSKGDSKVFKNINGANMVFEGNNPILKGIYGDGGVGQGPYSPYALDLEMETNLSFSPVTGRSTYNHFPYFNLEHGDGGTFIAIGWPIMWSADFKSDKDGVHFIGRQKSLETYLKPGETIRTPLMSFLSYTGRDENINMNLWRRWFIDCNMRKIDGKLFEPVISGGTSWIYNEMVEASDDNQIAAIKTYIDNQIPLSYWWMDAGWYFKTGDTSLSTWLDTGTWMVDTKRFPSEFAAISDYGKTVGVKTLLWFEPEVVRLDWAMHDEEYGIPWDFMLHPNLVDFGNKDFVVWYANRVSSIIDKGGISLYRQDYGINPESMFTASNRDNRVGINENLYAQGYLDYWDLLIERYPNMMIDSCAAGGGRNDLESMRRSVPLHKTDHDYSNYTDKQAMHQALFSWLPYFGTPVSGPDRCQIADEYGLKSAYVPWLALVYDVNHKGLKWSIVKESCDEWKQIKDFFYSNYYPLTKWSNTDTDMRGWEFFDPDKDAGFFQLFRPEKCDSSSITIRLYGLDDDTIYLLTDTKGNVIFKEEGKLLMTSGIEIELAKKRSSRVILIKADK